MADIPRSLLDGWDVLVVDDEPFSRDVASRILKFYGATVWTAENGREALAIIPSVRPKFIISDISMPVMDGWGFIKRMKADRELLDIPVIALTAHAMVGDREKAMAAGFHNYLSKPLNPATFMKQLLTLLVDVPELKLDFGE
jgi:CheY-like chemotaxis protein